MSPLPQLHDARDNPLKEGLYYTSNNTRYVSEFCDSFFRVRAVGDTWKAIDSRHREYVIDFPGNFKFGEDIPPGKIRSDHLYPLSREEAEGFIRANSRLVASLSAEIAMVASNIDRVTK